MKFFMPDQRSFFNKLMTSNKNMECTNRALRNLADEREW